MLFSIIVFLVEIWKRQKHIAYSHIFIILAELQTYSVGILIGIATNI